MKTLHKIIFIATFIFFFQGNSFAQITGGTHTIGEGTYTYFTDAIEALEPTLTDNVIFNVKAGTYTENIVLPNLTLNGHTVTFQKEEGETDIVELIFNTTNTPDSSVVKIIGSGYKFNNINFTNTSDNPNIQEQHVIEIDTDINTDSIEFNNCKFTGRTDLTGSDQSNSNYSVIYSTSSFTSKITFSNSTIIGGSYSIYIYKNELNLSPLFEISNCIIKDFYSTGINFHHVNSFKISNNTITNKSGVSNVNNTPSIGILISSPNKAGFIISSNKINLQRDYNKICIELSDITKTTSSNDSYAIYNNMLTTRAEDNSTFNSKGIYLSNCSYTKVIHNSIYIKDGEENSSAAFEISGGGSTENTLLNNLLINVNGKYSMILSDATVVSDFNHNDYYSSGGTSIIKYNNMDYTLEDTLIAKIILSGTSLSRRHP